MSSKKQIVFFCATTPYVMIYKIAREFRKKGYETVLVTISQRDKWDINWYKDVFSREFPIGNLTDPSFQMEDKFKPCKKYGQCHPCDVKLKTNYQQELGHTSVEIRDIF